MTTNAIIGGTGLTRWKGLEVVRREVVRTPYGEPSGPIVHGTMSGASVAFLPRHGTAHTIPPHEINYRANIWALREVGVRNVIAVNAVGSIDPSLAPGQLVIPDQIIDYTWSRGHTFFEHELSRVVHVDFTHPYSEAIRTRLCGAARELGLPAAETATYAVTQGPRLESAAEIDRLERDGCDIVGMTGMPEAALARELELDYAACAVVVNLAAGRGEEAITKALIERHLKVGLERVRTLLEKVITEL